MYIYIYIYMCVRVHMYIFIYTHIMTRICIIKNAYEFLDLLTVEFEVYLTGGATKEMLENSVHSKNKEFIPYDEINDENIKTTEYRVIEPIINALDTLEIKNTIFGAKR